MVLSLISIWVGVILFFSSVIAPTIFTTVDEKSAGLFLRSFFPKYYVFGIIIGFITLVILFTIERNHDALVFFTVSAMFAIYVFSRLMIPAINRARDAGESEKRKFDRLHLLSVILNFTTLIIGLFLIYYLIKNVI